MPSPIPPHLASSEASCGELHVSASRRSAGLHRSRISLLATVRNGNCQLSPASAGAAAQPQRDTNTKRACRIRDKIRCRPFFLLEAIFHAGHLTPPHPLTGHGLFLFIIASLRKESKHHPTPRSCDVIKHGRSWFLLHNPPRSGQQKRALQAFMDTYNLLFCFSNSQSCPDKARRVVLMVSRTQPTCNSVSPKIQRWVIYAPSVLPSPPKTQQPRRRP